MVGRLKIWQAVLIWALGPWVVMFAASLMIAKVANSTAKETRATYHTEVIDALLVEARRLREANQLLLAEFELTDSILAGDL
jgi:hypothetical protein